MPFYTPSGNNKSNNEYDGYSPITVISHYSQDGHINPLWIKYINPDESVTKVNIDSVKLFKGCKGWVSYCCLVTVDGLQKQVTLLYLVSECIWLIADKF